MQIVAKFMRNRYAQEFAELRVGKICSVKEVLREGDDLPIPEEKTLGLQLIGVLVDLDPLDKTARQAEVIHKINECGGDLVPKVALCHGADRVRVSPEG